jgi:hypothetical protein
MPKPVIPTTRATILGYGLLYLSIPLIGYKAFHRLTGQPINYRSTVVLCLGGLTLFGVVVGLALLGIETIRSAFRDSADE